MTRRWIWIGTAAVAAACGGTKPPPPRPTAAATVSSRCPDLGKQDEVAAFDFAKEYALSRDAADKLKAAALAASEIEQLAEKLDADLGIACANVAHGLGSKGDWRSGNEACAAAVKAVHDARAKLGPKASTKLVFRAPLCLADASLMTKCASLCDSSVPAEKAQSDCAKKVGRCDGNCDGACETKAPTKCDGVCAGTCDGAIRGTCSGRCLGTCDGKPARGAACAGTCAGTCDKGAVMGECKGSCNGSCKPAKPGICDGMCTGACSVELSDVKCAGELKTPEVSTDCRARCELAVMNNTECAAPRVGLLVVGTKDRETSEALRSAVDRSFPGLVKVLFEVGDKASKRVLNAQAIVAAARSGFEEMARSGGKGSAAASKAQLTKCFEEPFKKAEASAAAVKTEIDQAQGVRDEAAK